MSGRDLHEFATRIVQSGTQKSVGALMWRRGRRAFFRVIVERRNCLIDFEGDVQKHGFFATRFVHDDDDDRAGRTAIQKVAKELRRRLLNAENDPPMFRVHELAKVARVSQPKSGFTWYREPPTVQ